jgi:outer membrane immunogenic protein
MHRIVVSFFLSAFVILGTAAVASAADMRVKAPAYKAPPPIAGYNWTGCYIGGNVGYGWQRTTSTDVEPNAPPPFDAGTGTGTGIVGGGQVGCDYQFASSWVFGIQGMFDGAGVDGSHIVPFSYAGTNPTFPTRRKK